MAGVGVGVGPRWDKPVFLYGHDGTNDGVCVLPTVDLDFLNTGSLPSGVTFTRSTTGTYYNTSGVLSTAAIDAPRFDCDPLTGTRRGLLVEGLRTNLLLRSEEIDNAAWNLKIRSSITANATAAPDSVASADKLVEDTTASNDHYTQQPLSKAASALSYAASVYVKAGERSQIQLLVYDTVGGFGNRASATFDSASGGSIITAAAVAGTFTAPSATVVSCANGWVRISLRFTSGTETGIAVRLSIAVVGSTTYTGDGTSGIYVWGAQLEQAKFESSYIKTTTATVTRGADYCYTTVADIFGSALTMFAEFMVPALETPPGSNRSIIELTDGSSTIDHHGLYVQASIANAVRQITRSDGSGTTANAVSGSTVPTGVPVRVAYSARDNAFYITRDSEAAGSDLAGATAQSPLTKLGIGYDGLGATGRLFGWIRRAILWNVALPAATLSYLTRNT